MILIVGQKMFITTYQVEDNPEMEFGKRYSVTIEKEVDKDFFQCVYNDKPWSFYLCNAIKSLDGLFFYHKKDQCYFPIKQGEQPTIKIELI